MKNTAYFTRMTAEIADFRFSDLFASKHGTVLMTPSNPPRTIVHALFATLLAAAVLVVTACGGGGDVEGAAVISNLSVSPQAGYPDVEVTVSFDLEPGDGVGEDEVSWRVGFGDGINLSGDSLSGEARHRYDLAGSFTILVEALVDGDVADSQEVSFQVYDPVALTISSATGQPTNVLVGESLTVSSTLRNETAGPIFTPITLRAFLSQDPDVTREDLEDLPVIGDAVVNVGDEGFSLDGGAVRNVGVNHPVPEVETGQYHVVVVVDPDDEISNTRRDDAISVSANRVRIENQSEARPDISVMELEVLPDRAFPELNRVTRAFTLANLGGQDVFQVVHRTYLQVGSPDLDDSAILLHESSPITLAGFSEQTIGPNEFILSESILPPTDGELEVYIIVEAYSEDNIEEARDDNNEAISDPPILVSDQPVDGPDIAVHTFEVSPLSTFLGGTLQVNTTIANDGTEDVGSFFCGIYMGQMPMVQLDADPRLSNINISSMAAGQVRELERTVTIPAFYDPGNYYFYIVCDPNGILNEPFRGNNQMIQFDAVNITDEADIDLFVSEVVLPESADDGDVIEVEATICVSGSNPTGNTVGELYRSSGSSVNFNAEPYKTFELPNINPGECLERTFEVVARCEDFTNTMNVGIYVDSEQALPETNLSNNQLASTVPVQLDGLYCTCEEDDFAPNHRPLDAVDLLPGEYDAAVCSVGECDYFAVELNQGESAVITMEHETDRGPLKTTLFAPGGSLTIDEDTSADLQEVGVFLAGDDLRYIFSICGNPTTIRNYYSFELDVIPLAPTVDVLPRNVSIPFQDTYSVGATMDVDFRIYNLGQEPTGDFTASIVLTTEREIGGSDDITLALHDVDSMSASSFRDVSFPATLPSSIPDGDYYLAIVLDPAGDLNEENTANNVAFSPSFSVVTECFDPFTPNDSFSQAASVSPGTYSNLVACAGSSDYYEICAPNGHSMTARILFDSDQGDLDATLYNDQLAVVDTSAQAGTDLEEVHVEYVNGDQCYYLRVFLVSLDPDAEITYQLQVELEELPPELQCDATFEPNNDFASATSLWAALQHESLLNRCPEEDVDFYSVQLSPASTVNFRGILDPAQQPGNLRLQLYRPNGTPDALVETAPGIPVAEISNYQPPVSGLYFLQVSISGDERRVTYRLEADGLPGVDLAVQNLSIGPGTYVPQDELRYGYLLRNFGGDPVSDFGYAVYFGESSTLNMGSDQLLGSFDAPDLGPDDGVEIDGQVYVPTDTEPGTYYLHIIVDPGNTVGDVNLNNNRASVPVIVVEAPDDGNGDDNGDDN